MKLKVGDRELTDEEAEEYFKTPQGQYARAAIPMYKRMLSQGCVTSLGIAVFLFVMLLWALELFWPF